MQNIEQQLIERLASGDETVFNMLFKAYYGTMVYLANDIVHDTGLAEEVVQDVFVKLWESRAGISINSSLSAYLVKMVRNRSIDCLRANARQIKTVSIDSPEVQVKLHEIGMDTTFEEELFSTSLEIAFQHALKQLPPQCRRIFLLNRFDGHSPAEIADMLQISVSTVKTQITRALQKLKASLQPFLK